MVALHRAKTQERVFCLWKPDHIKKTLSKIRQLLKRNQLSVTYQDQKVVFESDGNDFVKRIRCYFCIIKYQTYLRCFFSISGYSIKLIILIFVFHFVTYWSLSLTTHSSVYLQSSNIVSYRVYFIYSIYRIYVYPLSDTR